MVSEQFQPRVDGMTVPSDSATDPARLGVAPMSDGGIGAWTCSGRPWQMAAGFQAEEIADRLLPARPRISPDGSRILFTVRPASRRGAHRTQDIWVGGSGQPARPFTAGAGNDAEPEWSPDGQSIVFHSDRETRGTGRLYVIPAGGGEAQPLSSISGDLSHPVWSPDGKTVAVLRVDTAPDRVTGPGADDAVVVGTDLCTQRLWLVDVASGASRQFSYGRRSVWSHCWLPDGQSLAVVVADSPEIDAVYGPADLMLIPAAGGLPIQLAAFAVMPTDPTPVMLDGATAIAVRGNSGREDPTDGIWLAPTGDDGGTRVRLESVGSVEELLPSPRPGQVAARLVERGRGQAVEIDLVSGAVHEIGTDPATSAGSAPSLSRDGRVAALEWSSGDAFEQMVLVSTDGSAPPRELTSFGTELVGRLNPTQTVRWASTDGVEIDGILTLPRGHDSTDRLSLVVQIHGGPSGAWESGLQLTWHDWAQYLASHGYAVLMPNPRGSTSYGAAFQRLLQDDVGGGEMRDLVTGAQAMVATGVADPERIGIGGWSWGGYLTAWTTTQTTLFRAAVMGAGVANLASDHSQNDLPGMNFGIFPGHPYSAAGQDAYLRPSPISQVGNVRTPTLILHGDEDVRVRPEQGAEFHRALLTLGVPVEFVRYPREGHGIAERGHQIDVLRRVLAWYDRWLRD